MRYAKLSCTEFYFFIYINAPQLTYSLTRTPGHGQKFSWNWLLSCFFLELRMVLGTHVVLYMTARFFENRVFPSKWGKQTKARDLWMYRKAQLFFSVLYFFINLGYNESLYYCSSCMLEQISYLEKLWFLRYGPKCSCPIRLQDFSINCRALKLVVSQEINEIN